MRKVAKTVKIGLKTLDKLWSKLVREKYNKKCAICGAPNPHAHHIFSRSYKSTRWDIDNGVALCYKHHFFFAHVKYEEFRDFIISHIGSEAYDKLKEKSMIVMKPDLNQINDQLRKVSTIHKNSE